MARLFAGAAGGINMEGFDLVEFSQLTLTSRSPTQVIGDFRALGEPNYQVVFDGADFSYGAQPYPVGGTLTRITAIVDGKTLYDLSDISVPMPTFNQWLQGPAGPGTQALFSGTDFIQGSGADDRLLAYDGWDVFRPLGGNDFVDGGTGLDTVNVDGARSASTVQALGNGAFALTGVEGRDELVNVERIAFLGSNQMVGLDINGDGGQAYRLYKAAFDRTPDETGLGFWINRLDGGMDLIEASARFIDSNEFRSIYGTNPSNADFLFRVYSNVLDRAPDQAGFDWWLNQMNTNPEKTPAKVLADFSESPENQGTVNPTIANGFPYELWMGG
jgi:hypothetical protein